MPVANVANIACLWFEPRGASCLTLAAGSSLGAFRTPVHPSAASKDEEEVEMSDARDGTNAHSVVLEQVCIASSRTRFRSRVLLDL